MTRQHRDRWHAAGRSQPPPREPPAGQQPPAQPPAQAPPERSPAHTPHRAPPEHRSQRHHPSGHPPPQDPGGRATPARAGAGRAPGIGGGQPAGHTEGQRPGTAQPTAGRGAPARQGPDPIPIPAIDVYETDDEVTVLVDLPGCDEDDIRIRAENDQLTFAAERSDDVGGATVRQRERPTAFQRTVAIPSDADLEGASARYDDGVCTVTFPKSERRTRREIGFQ